eukprot:CAMPEP_0194540146 /NCGR_PEP_ID=MMETSP0253-20130528/80320_1 /TAXON_ID=2966 /ORGANISM="Noctiluca scintillans" /LENGTH=59 /DNA_ID=CAMNT_0039386489 /DNA_START=136 /DNA_END=315 /DNA_ORIENTATION=+
MLFACPWEGGLARAHASGDGTSLTKMEANVLQGCEESATPKDAHGCQDERSAGPKSILG